MRVYQWTPADHQAGTAVLIHASKAPAKNVVWYDNADLFRAVMVGLIEAEAGLDMALQKVGVLPSGPDGTLYRMPSVVGNRDREARGPLLENKFTGPGNTILLAYQALQRSGRRIVRGSYATNESPLFGGTMGPVILASDDDIQGGFSRLIPGKSLAPVVAVLIGVLGVAALAAAGYVGGEHVKSSSAVEAEKLRVHAELTLKQQALTAQIAAGQPLTPDVLTMSEGMKEERMRLFLPGMFAGLGVAALSAYAVKRWQGK